MSLTTRLQIDSEATVVCDYHRLRSAMNSDGLLAVLGAAQILKAMQDGSAKRRTEESFLAVEEWVSQGEQSMAFRLASWHDQRAA
jgi:hypothetical protein